MFKVDEIFKSVFQDKQWPAKIAIGGVVSAVPVLGLCALGYSLNLLRNTIKNDKKELPEWDEWGKLFTDGIQCFVIMLAYMIIPFVILGAGAGARVVSWIFAGLISLIAMIAALAAGFVLPMALCNFVSTGDLKSAFSWKVIQEKIKSSIKDYGIAYLLIIGLYIAISLICLPLAFLIIGWILLPFLLFFACIIWARMFGQVYSQIGRE